ncbi:CopG family transcriptional regulator [Demequina sp. SYSU T00192]|uniref:CopG family transcriptional regulator n=1 Tax=Demequina litoralis TaxID=3051660 RepID=A0ABT8GCH8_9MICO|nr:CopG family transcriptional regulator [Demequina sp. SYSU T00192]MDN4476852.1 CopG family transcriptional regulator [Demequina sp. SYSU T00192]
MKTAISLPDGDFERFERIAARHGMSRSQFYRLAAGRLADELEGGSELTAVANSVLEREGVRALETPLLSESERIVLEGSDW